MNLMRSFLVVCAFCATIVNSFNTMLVQGHQDTIRALRSIIRHTSHPINKMDPPIRPTNENSFMKIKHLRRDRPRRHISNAVIESGHCEHIDLMDCSDFDSDEMTCMLTATGMTCCVCTGSLRASKRDLF